MPVSLTELAHRQDPARRPDHLREREQPRPRRDRGADRIRVGRDDDDPARPDVASAPSRPKCSSVVVTISSSGPSPSPPRTMLQPSVVLVVSATCSGSAPTSAAMRCTQLIPQLHHAGEVRATAAAVAVVALELRADRLVRRAGDRAEGAGVEIGELLEHGELRPGLLEGHAIVSPKLPCVLGRYRFAVMEQTPKAESLGLADARRDRRSPRLHASVRLRARRRARAAAAWTCACSRRRSASEPCPRPRASRSTTACIGSRAG